MKITKRLPLKNLLTYHPEIKDRTEEVLERKSLVSTFTPLEDGEAIGVISTPTVDSDGDIIDPMGIKTDIYTGALIFNHCLDTLPIGNVSEFTMTPEGVKGKFTFSKTYDFSVDCYNLIKEGILRGISIGYIPLKALKRGTSAFNEYAKAKGWDIAGCERIITECLWIETSCVTVGANSDALILAAKNFKSELAFKNFKIEDKGCKEPAEKVIEPVVEEIVNETEISKDPEQVGRTEQVDTNLPEETISENTEVIPQETIPEVQVDSVNTEEIIPEVEVPAETSPVEPKQASVESEAVTPSIDTTEEVVEPKAIKPLVFKVIRMGKRLSDETIKTKALRFLQGKSI